MKRATPRHQNKGCHAWSAGPGTPYKAALSLKLAPRIVDHPGAAVKIVFAKAGVYRFKTRFGEDYMKMPDSLASLFPGAAAGLMFWFEAELSGSYFSFSGTSRSISPATSGPARRPRRP